MSTDTDSPSAFSDGPTSDSDFERFETYHDRKAWMIALGATELLGAGLVGLMTAWTIYMSQQFAFGGSEMQKSMLAGQLAIQLPLALFLAILGYGTMRCRRWACAIGHAASYIGLAIGVASTIGVGLTISPLLTNIREAGGGATFGPMEAIMIGTMLLFTVGFYVVPPVVAFLLYRSRHTKATCLMRDRTPRWTDSRPIPLLTMHLALAIVIVMSCSTAILGSPTPFFGRYVSGNSALMLGLGTAALFGAGLVGLDRRAWWGWGLTLLALPTVFTSSVVTMLHADVADMYRQMGMNEDDIAQVTVMAEPGMRAGMVSSGIYGLLAVGWLIYIARYMGRRTEAEQIADGQNENGTPAAEAGGAANPAPEEPAEPTS